MIAIIDYNAGNTRSVKNALERLGYEAMVTSDADMISKADKVIFPGVGEAGSAMKYLRELNLDLAIKSLTQPFLGICLGLQLMCLYSEEGDTTGLGIYDTEVRKFPPTSLVPHMGWNTLTDLKGPLFSGLPESSDLYFVHSYYAGLCSETAATCEYIFPFSAAMQRDNFFAVQFHPEKSADTGEHILKNFLAL
ncbi:MAG: imidazole glycerol phosphate synthase subunit HisH [Saprospiraceae bacterium]|nr:imidazole glycerol phosphate synthase subunit HisH [Candidatus Opimibacter skivensis]